MDKRVLKNAAFDSEPTIKIVEGDPEWEIAYNNWKAGKSPTDSPEWKKGVFLGWIKE